jgi:hypothetical protein
VVDGGNPFGPSRSVAADGSASGGTVEVYETSRVM